MKLFWNLCYLQNIKQITEMNKKRIDSHVKIVFLQNEMKMSVDKTNRKKNTYARVGMDKQNEYKGLYISEILKNEKREGALAQDSKDRIRR